MPEDYRFLSFRREKVFRRLGFQSWSLALPVVSLETHSARQQHPKHQGSHGVPGCREGPRGRGAWLEEAASDRGSLTESGKRNKGHRGARATTSGRLFLKPQNRGGGPRTKLRLPELVPLLGLGSVARPVQARTSAGESTRQGPQILAQMVAGKKAGPRSTAAKSGLAPWSSG